ncbi:homocysteine S-methyltransferase family protein [Poseidonocella sp. HB161398]|uniref:homocysteine S-methyltransferase family protein n=1 Tax=Poseidonocella sp. HB161398 TaxID=2320855 RepID=UPI001108FB4D|nr:homocysteine S-methyltransferase family protein [Poseidonocella sp. HB161398]
MLTTTVAASGGHFLTDGGIETTLIFHEGHDLPLFAAYTLLDTAEGRESLRAYYRRYLALAAERGLGFILESPTWRCSTGWGAQLGHSEDQIAAFNRQAIAEMRALAAEAAQSGAGPVLVSGNIGPAGDGYAVGTSLDPAAAAAYHRHQIAALAAAGADMITAVTMTHSGEAAGIAAAVRATGLPCVIAFTLETDGRLPSGESLGEAIRATDAASGGHPAYYMINCAHPDHFRGMIAQDPAVAARIGGLRANASRMSHAELDEATELDDGNPDELGRDYRALAQLMPNLRVFGGCCGTDHRHVAAIADHCCGAA